MKFLTKSIIQVGVAFIGLLSTGTSSFAYERYDSSTVTKAVRDGFDHHEIDLKDEVRLLEVVDLVGTVKATKGQPVTVELYDKIKFAATDLYLILGRLRYKSPVRLPTLNLLLELDSVWSDYVTKSTSKNSVQ